MTGTVGTRRRDGRRKVKRSEDLNAVCVKQISGGLEHIAHTLDMYCETLREIAPDSSPAMHAVMHMSAANAELSSAEYLLEDVQ